MRHALAWCDVTSRFVSFQRQLLLHRADPPRSAVRMGVDLEARVAALEDEKRKLLESWHRERETCASQRGTYAALRH